MKKVLLLIAIVFALTSCTDGDGSYTRTVTQYNTDGSSVDYTTRYNSGGIAIDNWSYYNKPHPVEVVHYNEPSVSTVNVVHYNSTPTTVSTYSKTTPTSKTTTTTIQRSAPVYSKSSVTTTSTYSKPVGLPIQKSSVTSFGGGGFSKSSKGKR